MSRKLQWPFWATSTSPIREVWLFVGLFVGTRHVLRAALWWLGDYLNYSSQLKDQVLDNNELFFQVAALTVAFLGFMRFRAIRLTWDNFAALWRENSHTKLRAERFNIFSTAFFGGFALVSAGIAVSVFFGFSGVEAPRWEGFSLLDLLPSLVLRASLTFVWILALELARRLLWDLLVRRHPQDLLGRCLIIAFEAYAVFFVLTGSGGTFEKAFLALASVWISSLLLLSFEVQRDPLKRVAFVGGVTLSALHAYGLPLAGTRYSSLLYVVAGPGTQPTGTLAEQSFLGQLVFVFVFVLVANALLQRWLSRTSHNS